MLFWRGPHELLLVFCIVQVVWREDVTVRVHCNGEEWEIEEACHDGRRHVTMGGGMSQWEEAHRNGRRHVTMGGGTSRWGEARCDRRHVTMGEGMLRWG